MTDFQIYSAASRTKVIGGEYIVGLKCEILKTFQNRSINDAPEREK